MLGWLLGGASATGKKGNKKGKGAEREKRQKKQRIVLDSFENYLHLVTMIDYELRNRRVGAYLLKKNDRLQFVFGFETEGYHHILGDKELEVLFNKLESGLRDFPLEEDMTVHYRDFCTLGEREKEINELWEKTENETIQLMLKSQLARDRELVRDGRRREKRIILYCTYTVDFERQKTIHNSWVEKAVAWLYYAYEKVFQEKRAEREKFERLVYLAFLDGYLRWENFLSTTIGLDIRSLRHEELWGLVWERLNKGKPIEVPQVIEVRESGIKEIIRSTVHPTTLLIAEREPVADDLWVYVRDRYVGALALVDKPAGWADKRAQLRYVWDSLIAKERTYDIEIFAQINRANDRLVQESVRRLLAQSVTSKQMAEDVGTIDVGAELRVKKAVHAQAQILEGSVPFWLGFVILVHRKTPEDLDEICRYIEACFLRPAWVERERFLTWRVWLQTLPICWERPLTKPSNRRLLFLHSEVIGFLPLVKPQKMDKQGVELITDEGYYPLFIDMIHSPEPFHIMLLAMTRSGKSVLCTLFWYLYLAEHYGVTIFDFPRGDGTSTFTDITQLLGGSYINIILESINCMEYPDFSHFSPERQAAFIDVYHNSIKDLFFTIIMGTSGANYSTKLGTQVRAIIELAVDGFFNHPEIKKRIELGRRDPSAMPTGYDFFRFIRPENIELEHLGDLTEAFNYIELRLRQFLNSVVGKAIMQRSTLSKDNPLTVYAFTNVSNDDDAAILSLVGLSAAVRNSLKYERSLMFIDEAPILFDFPTVGNVIGRLCANGAKAGISVMVSAQDPDTIAKSPSASKIFQAMSCTLIGRIKPTAIPSFVKYLNLDEMMIRRNATKAFFPKVSELYSQWLLDYHGHKTYCRFYPGILQLALVANNPDEQRLRDQIIQSAPNRYEGYKELCRRFLQKKRG